MEESKEQAEEGQVVGIIEEPIDFSIDQYKKGRFHGFLWGMGFSVAVYLILRRWK